MPKEKIPVQIDNTTVRAWLTYERPARAEEDYDVTIYIEISKQCRNGVWQQSTINTSIFDSPNDAWQALSLLARAVEIGNEWDARPPTAETLDEDLFEIVDSFYKEEEEEEAENND